MLFFLHLLLAWSRQAMYSEHIHSYHGVTNMQSSSYGACSEAFVDVVEDMVAIRLAFAWNKRGVFRDRSTAALDRAFGQQ
jgi:hypothetical protein